MRRPHTLYYCIKNYGKAARPAPTHNYVTTYYYRGP